jgi:hypothetical protein
MKFVGKIYLPLFVLFSASVVSADTEKPAAKSTLDASTNEGVQQGQSLQNVLSSIDDLKATVEKHSKKKYADCMKAFGSATFCSCLRDKSPIGIDFSGYIQIVTASKEELQYDTMSKENKEVIDNTLAVHDACAPATAPVPVQK